MSSGRNFRGGLAVALALLVVGSACASKPRTANAPQASSADAGDVSNGGDAEADEDADDEATETAEADGGAPAGPCPADMALVETASLRACVDKYEASLVEVLPDGTERPYAHYLPVDGHDVRAVSVPHVFPQGYISEVQAQDACGASGKHLCKPEEWKAACMGPSHTTFPYGDARRPRRVP